jgi:hypothetical protein
MDRDNKGMFIKGNQTVKGLKHAFKPRKKRNLYKVIGEMLLNNSTEEQLISKIHLLPIEEQFKVILFCMEQSSKIYLKELEHGNSNPIDIVVKGPND